MKEKRTLLALFVSFLLFVNFFENPLSACSTFKLQKGNALIYGHNLNEADIGVPGLVFINPRGIFKTGKTWSELTTPEKLNPSSLCWISRYGSVTINNFGRDFPDGGMNEAGLFIWEMNEDAEYPKGDSFPKLNQMNWMQYILDNFSSVKEVVQGALEMEIDGWGWHFFVGDGEGNTAAVAFVNGKAVVETGENMPVPALFNTPYKRELELLKYYKGFGGNYEPDINDPKVPRFVRSAVLMENYQPEKNAVDYGFYMLKTLRVNDDPEWSVIFDVPEKKVYFRTRLNPEIKMLAMNEINFSNSQPVSLLNIDEKEGGNVLPRFQKFSNQMVRNFTTSQMFPILPEAFFTRGGITKEEYLDRISTHTDSYSLPENQFFAGIWKNKPDTTKDEMSVTFKLETQGDAVKAFVSNSDGKDYYTTDHLQLIGNHLKCTFKTKGGTLLEIQGEFQNGRLKFDLFGIEDYFGTYFLDKLK